MYLHIPLELQKQSWISDPLHHACSVCKLDYVHFAFSLSLFCSLSSSGQPPAFLQCGDFVYPLVPGKSPILHSSGGAYVFSELGETEDEQGGGSVGVVVKGMSPDEMGELDHVSCLWLTSWLDCFHWRLFVRLSVFARLEYAVCSTGVFHHYFGTSFTRNRRLSISVVFRV